MRLATRQPYPVSSQLRHVLVGWFYRILSAIVARVFRRRIEPAQLRIGRILILKPCCLGDVVFATPLVREIRAAFPGADLIFAVGQHSRAAVVGNPHLDGLLDTGAVGNAGSGLRDIISLARMIRREKFNACFVLERSGWLNLVPLLAGIPHRIGIDSGGRGFSLGVAVPVRPPRPESELYLDLLRAIGGRPTTHDLEFHPSSSDRAVAAEIARHNRLIDRPWVMVHCSGGVNPGMSLTRKRWPAEYFRELIQRIVASGAVAVLVGAPDDRPIADSLKLGSEDGGVPPGATPSIVDLVGKLSLGELATLATLARAYVGNDSGPTHLAEAAGGRVVMLFGPSDSIVYGPRSSNAVALVGTVWCSPCFEDGRFPPCLNVRCMRSVTVDRVWRELRPLLTPVDQSR